MSKMIDFGNNLKKLRISAGLTRNALAAVFSYSPKAVEKWEAGASFPPLTVITELSDYFGVGLEELIYKKGNKVKYFLGIDGGGTKTAFLLTDDRLRTVSECVLESSNPIDIGIERCRQVLSLGIGTVCHGINKSEISVFAGISGVESPETAKKIADFLRGMRFARVGVGNDIENVIEISLADKNGIAMICGTGIAAYVINGGKRIKIAGNGYLLDNGGSGYDIGRDGFEAAFRELDGRGEKTLISKLLKEKLGEPLNKSIDRIYSGGKRFIASACETVFEAYNAGDKVAEKIIEKNAKSIAEIIKAGLQHFDTEGTDVAVCGGLCNRSEILTRFLVPLLPEKCNIKFVNGKSVTGAVLRAEKAVKNDEY